MLFDPPNVQLAAFTKQHCRKKSLADIPPRHLRNWQKLTHQTAGRHLGEYMAPARWSDSVASLQTAVAILITYTPAALKDGDAYQQAIGALRRKILRDSKRTYEARHGKLSLKPHRK
jgi:hypothetical protein